MSGDATPTPNDGDRPLLEFALVHGGADQHDGTGLAGAAPLIATKLAPPRLHERLVSRPRLFEVLNQATMRPVTIVSGGAGAGKTLAVASWMESGRPPGPVAWVSLDSDDNDPARFWSHVLAALRSCGVIPADNPLAELVPLQHPSDTFYGRLAGGLAQLPQPVVLVLDDLHQVTDRGLLARLAALLRRPPPTLRLVLITRVDPQLSLARLRLAGQLGEVRADDLAFTPAEAADLFAQSGLVLTPTEIDRLVERTEGWAAGLRLATQSFQSKTAAGQQATVSQLVDQFVGDDQSVIDYLLEEVLSGLPDADRDFLLRTSVVDEVCAELAETLTGRPDSQCLLETLERSNAFVMQVGTGRVWFRFHQLYREMLVHELLLHAPALVPATHRAAAAWYHSHNEPIPALRHAIAARDWAFIDALAIHSLVPHILGPDRETFCALLGQLPEEQIQTHAGLSLAIAMRNFLLRDVEGMSGRAAAAVRLAADQVDADRAPILVIVRLLQMTAARLNGDAVAVIDAATRAESLLAGIPADIVPAPVYQALILVNRGVSLLWTGRLVEAERELSAGFKTATAAGLELSQMSALGHLALISVGRGELRAAHARARAAVDIAERRGWTAEALTATGYLALALCHYEWDNLEEARRCLDLATVAHQDAHEPAVEVGLQLAGARFARAAGDVPAVRTAITAARAVYDHRPLPAFLHRLLTIEQSDLDLATGRPDRVRDRFPGLDTDGGDADSTDRERVRLALAQLALGHPQQAGRTVEPLLTDQPTNPGPAVEAWLLTALAADRLREDARALDAVSHALKLAAPETRRRPFTAADRRVHELLSRHARLVGTEPDFVEEILTDLTQLHAPRLPPAPLDEPLTDRETAILRYLPTLFTNAELADQLYISVNTAKAHLKSLYRKLNVTSRRQAVHRARELGLL
ncbi:MAG: LuxR C-terminal-related transcriptional regulator [Frankiaceae bacterium]